MDRLSALNTLDFTDMLLLVAILSQAHASRALNTIVEMTTRQGDTYRLVFAANHTRSTVDTVLLEILDCGSLDGLSAGVTSVALRWSHGSTSVLGVAGFQS